MNHNQADKHRSGLARKIVIDRDKLMERLSILPVRLEFTGAAKKWPFFPSCAEESQPKRRVPILQRPGERSAVGSRGSQANRLRRWTCESRGTSLIARVVRSFRMAFELFGIEVDVAEVSGGIALGFVVEMF
jgi:hypothetical protein